MLNMHSWIQNRFRDAQTSFATAMALAGITGMLCCGGVILIVLSH